MNWRIVAVMAILALQGCVQPPPKPVPPPAPVVKAPRHTTKVVVLVSERVPAYTQVAKALTRLLGKRGTIRYLDKGPMDNIRELEPYRKEKDIQFVSIGLGASVAAKTLSGHQVVFCQVFNYQDYGLLSSRHKGVSMVPSISRTFAAWHAIAPRTTDVGVIVGPGFDDLLRIASEAAKSHGIKLHTAVVNTDKEYQFAYKQMADEVQGYWLLPDNRVLSSNVLRDVMTFSVRNSKQMMVFSNEMLTFGGLFSAATDYRNIAMQVLERLERGEGKDELPGPDISYPDRVVLRINPVMAQRLNLKIPSHYRKYAKEL